MDLTNIEYVIYDGYDSICDALTTIANIFTNSGYSGIFYTASILGIFLGLAAYFYRNLAGARVSPFAMLTPVLAGVIIYIALFVPKTKITVYDKSSGLFQTFNDIPLGIGVMAGVINKIENGLIEIFDTSSLYKDSAGGRGVEALMMLYSEAGKLDPYIDRSLDEYIEDCFAFEVGRPGGSINFGDLDNGTLAFITAFRNAQNPAVWTLTYLGSGGSGHVNGVPVTCTEAWNRIESSIQASAGGNIDKMIKNACMSVGYFPDSGSQSFDACKDMLSKHIAYVKDAAASPTYGSGSYDVYTFARKLYFTRRIDGWAQTGQVGPLGNYNLGVQGVSTAAMLSQWIPYIKAVLTALVFSITPLLLIFLPTPIFGRVIALIFGFFLWLAFWSVSDAVVHNAMGNMMFNYFETFRSKIASGGDIGYGSLLTMTAPAAKTLTVFGYVRAGAVTLATVITSILVKFGSHTLARFAGGLTGNIASAGAQAGNQTLHALGSASTIKSATDAAGTYDWAAANSFMTRRNAAAALQNLQTWRGIGVSNAIRDGLITPKSTATSSAYSETKTQMLNNRVVAKFGGNIGKAAGTMADVEAGTQLGRVDNAQRLVDQGAAENLQDASRKTSATMAYGQGGSAVEALGGNMNDVYKYRRGSEESKIGQIEALDRTARSMDMDIRGFSNLIATGNYAKLGQAIEQYARLRGIKNLSAAAREMGNVLGTKEGALAEGERDGLNVVGPEGYAFMRTNEILNESAKFEQTYQFAKSLGYAKSREDFAGIYRGHKAHHAMESWVLQDQTAVNNLNRMMQAQGYKTRFHVGDKVAMGRTADGRITFAKGGQGASREVVDVESLMSGKSIEKTMDPKNEEDRAFLKDLAEKIQGTMPNVAKGIRAALVNKKNPVTISARMTGDGEYATVVASSGGKVLKDDVRRNTEGWENTYKALTTERTGTDRQKIYRDTTTRDMGYGVNPTTMARFASPEATQQEISIIGGDIYGQNGEINSHNAQMQAVAFADISQKVEKKEGSIFSQGVLKGGGKISIEANDKMLGFDVLPFIDPKASASAGIDLNRYNREVYEYNLDYSFSRQMQEKARNMATINGVFHKDLASQYYHEGMGKYFQWKDEVAKGNNEFKFGASSIIAEPLIGALSFATNNSKEFRDAAKAIIDSGKPYPLASPEEKQRRMEALNKLTSQYKSNYEGQKEKNQRRMKMYKGD